MSLKRRKPAKMNVKVVKARRHLSHQQWVRGFECAVAGKVDACQGPIQFAHVRHGLPEEDKGGAGMKSNDAWGIPLCWHHHINCQHQRGVKTFEKTYGVDMKVIAEDLAKQSPSLQKLRRELEQG